MRVECPLCGELASVDGIRVAGTQVQVTCSSCHEDFELRAQVRRDVGEGDEQGACPKCRGEVPASASACPRCGLGVDKFEEFVDDAAEIDDRLQERWRDVEEEWSDGSRHDLFLDYAAATGAFREAARLYRDAGQDAMRRARSDAMLDKIQTMAAAAVLTSAPRGGDDAKEPYKAVVVMLILLLAMAAAGGIYLMIKRAHHKRDGGVHPTLRKSSTRTPRVAPSRARPAVSAPKQGGTN